MATRAATKSRAKAKPAEKVRLLSIEEVSAFLQIPVATLYQWRFRGEGPPGMRVGRFVRYDPADLGRWLESREAVR